MFELPPPPDDHLIAPEVGPWSRDKHHFLQRYIDIFTTGMKNSPFRLHYVDLFAGAGIEFVSGYGREWGSALIAAQAPNQFHRLHLCEAKKDKHEALKQRLMNFPQRCGETQLLRGDANRHIHDIAATIPAKGTLTLAFLDPYGLHLDFETVKVLTADRKVDLLIYFPDRVDILRNSKLYEDQSESNLDRFLGSRSWRDVRANVPAARYGEVVRNAYIDQIRSLGYEFFDFERISRQDGVFLYQIIFCSRHERGAEFWRKITRRKSDGQTEFDWS